MDRRNLAAAFEEHVLADPTANALVVGDERWSRAEIAGLANRVTGLLVELGARPGDAVVSQYHTEAADIAVALAAARLGCTFVPIPVRLGPLEFSYVLETRRPGPAGAARRGARRATRRTDPHRRAQLRRRRERRAR